MTTIIDTPVETEVEQDVEIRERVRLGARTLDGIDPFWADLINVDQLRLASCSRCVAGQLRESDPWLHGRFIEEAGDEIGLDIPGLNEFPPSFGCDARGKWDRTAESVDGEFAVLQDEWEKQIRVRQRP